MITKLKNSISLKMAVFVLIGGIAGFAYYYFIGCAGNTCPISSNPYISTGYGMAAGLLLSWESKKNRNKDNA